MSSVFEAMTTRKSLLMAINEIEFDLYQEIEAVKNIEIDHKPHWLRVAKRDFKHAFQAFRKAVIINPIHEIYEGVLNDR